MPSVVIDAATRDKLLASNDPRVDLRDETGKLIGWVTLAHLSPTPPPGLDSSVGAGMTEVALTHLPPTPPPGYVIEGEWPSEEELTRREQTGRRHSPAEVMDRLRALKEKLG